MQETTKKYLIWGSVVLGGYAIYKYYSASKVLKNAMFTYNSLFLVGADLKTLTLGVRVNARATSQLNLGSLNLYLYCNGVKVGKLYLPYQQDLQKGEKELIFYCDVNIEYFARTFVTFILNKQVTLAIEGTLWYGGLPIAFPAINVLTSDLNTIYNDYLKNILPDLVPTMIGQITEADERKTLGYVVGEKNFFKKGFSSDIITACKNVLYDTYYQTKDLSYGVAKDMLSEEEQCMTIFDYCVKTFTYKLDPQGEQLIKTPSRFLSDKKGDCKSFAIFICSILTNLGIECVMRFVDMGEGDYRHVYAVAKLSNGSEFVLDVVATLQLGSAMGEEVAYVRKKDIESKYKQLIFNAI